MEFSRLIIKIPFLDVHSCMVIQWISWSKRYTDRLSLTRADLHFVTFTDFARGARSLEKNPHYRVQWNAVLKKFQYRKSTFSDSRRHGVAFPIYPVY